MIPRNFRTDASMVALVTAPLCAGRGQENCTGAEHAELAADVPASVCRQLATPVQLLQEQLPLAHCVVGVLVCLAVLGSVFGRQHVADRADKVGCGQSL